MNRREQREGLLEIGARWRSVSELEHPEGGGAIQRVVRLELRVPAAALGDPGLPKLVTVGHITRIGPQWHGFALHLLVFAHADLDRVKASVFDRAAAILTEAMPLGGQAGALFGP